MKLGGGRGLRNRSSATPSWTSAKPRRSKKASEAAKLPIHSVMNMAHWKFPLSSADPTVWRRASKAWRQPAQRNTCGAPTQWLLVPRGGERRYPLTRGVGPLHGRDQKMIPLAQKLKVVIACGERVGTIPAQPARKMATMWTSSRAWVKSYFDVGNVVLMGFPQDWIRTLGKRSQSCT